VDAPPPIPDLANLPLPPMEPVGTGSIDPGMGPLVGSTGGTQTTTGTLGSDGILTGEMENDRDLGNIRDLNEQIGNAPDILTKIDLINERNQIKSLWDDRVADDNNMRNWVANPFGDKGTTFVLDNAGNLVTVGKLGVLAVATIIHPPAYVALVAAAGGDGLKGLETITSFLTNAQKNYENNGGDGKKALLDAGLQQVSDEIVGRVFSKITGEGNEYVAGLLTEGTKKTLPVVNVSASNNTGSGGLSSSTTYDWGPGTLKASNGAVYMK
jgi:hypothetical protein